MWPGEQAAMLIYISPEMVAKLLATFVELTKKLDFAYKKISKLESRVNNPIFNASKKQRVIL
jgi:hypothetical protein